MFYKEPLLQTQSIFNLTPLKMKNAKLNETQISTQANSLGDNKCVISIKPFTTQPENGFKEPIKIKRGKIRNILTMLEERSQTH
jgi:hypothetical protein